MNKNSPLSALLKAILIGFFLANIMSLYTVKAATEVSGIIASDIKSKAESIRYRRFSVHELR